MSEQLVLERPRRITIVESVIEQVVGLIQNGTLKPGDKLPSERQLMEMLAVSRSSVREALQGLVAMDLIESRAGEGSFVKQVKPTFGLGLDIATLSTTLQKEMRLHVNQARLLVEREIIGLAADMINEAARAHILEALAVYESDANNGAADSDWETHNRIHLSIAEATGNPVLAGVLQSLLDLVPPTLRDKGFDVERPEQDAELGATEHEIHCELARAVAEGDRIAALAWLERHADTEVQVIDQCYGS